MPVTEYMWDVDNDSLLMETDGDGNATAVYTNTPDPYGELISQHRDGQTYYHHYDGQLSTRQVTDDSQTVVESATFTAFGETVTKTSSIVNPFGYKGALGYYTNGETEDIYVRARTYETTLARWLLMDPLGVDVWANLFAYCANSPLQFVDPSGLSFAGDPRPSGCQWENHHWIPREVRGNAERKCRGLGFTIDLFTTPLLRCWGNYKECDAHGWLHHERTPKWNPHIRKLVRDSKNCCDLLTRLAGEIGKAYAEIRWRFNVPECIGRRRECEYNECIRLEDYFWRYDSPELSQCTRVPTGDVLRTWLKECRERGRRISRPEDIVPDPGGGGLIPDRIPEIIVGGLGACLLRLSVGIGVPACRPGPGGPPPSNPPYVRVPDIRTPRPQPIEWPPVLAP